MNEVPAHLAITSYRKKKRSHQPLRYVLPREPISIDEQLHVFYHGKMVRNAKSHYSRAQLNKWSNEKSTPQRLVELEKVHELKISNERMGKRIARIKSKKMVVDVDEQTAVCDELRERLLDGRRKIRKRVNAQIEDRNMKMLKRIEEVKPVYNSAAWKREELVRERLKKTMSSFKPVAKEEFMSAMNSTSVLPSIFSPIQSRTNLFDSAYPSAPEFSAGMDLSFGDAIFNSSTRDILPQLSPTLPQSASQAVGLEYTRSGASPRARKGITVAVDPARSRVYKSKGKGMMFPRGGAAPSHLNPRGVAPRRPAKSKKWLGWESGMKEAKHVCEYQQGRRVGGERSLRWPALGSGTSVANILVGRGETESYTGGAEAVDLRSVSSWWDLKAAEFREANAANTGSMVFGEPSIRLVCACVTVLVGRVLSQAEDILLRKQR